MQHNVFATQIVWNEWNASVSSVRLPILLLVYPTRQSPSYSTALAAIKPLAKAKALEGLLQHDLFCNVLCLAATSCCDAMLQRVAPCCNVL